MTRTISGNHCLGSEAAIRRIKKLAVYALMAALAVSISGCGGGSSSSSNPPPPAGTMVNITFSGAAPLAVAEQIGSGSWTTASLQGGTLSLTIPQGTTNYAIAYVCPGWQGMGAVVNSEYVIEATTSDSTTYPVSCFAYPTTGSATGSANALAIAGATDVRVYGMQGYWNAVGSISGSFNATLPTGTSDIALVAVDGSSNVLGVKIVRSQTVPGAVNSGNMISLAASDATTPQTIAVTNIPAGFGTTPAVAVDYYTANGTWFEVNNNSATQYAAVASSEAQSGDYYLFETNTANTATNQSIGTTQTTTSAGAVTLAMPAPWLYSGPAPAALPSFSFSYTGFSSAKAVADVANIQWFPASTTLNSVTVAATTAYLNGATTVAIPDLTSLAGFFSAASSGTKVYWLADVYGGTAQWYSWYTAIPSSGSISFVQNSGSYIEP